MEKNLTSQEALDKLKGIAEDISICMYCTMDPKSDMASRPMGTVKVDADGTIWFFTDDDSTAGQEASSQKQVCLNYASTAKNTYMCVMGDSLLVKDKAKMKELWNDMMKTWFPDGLETPGISLIQVTPSSAHYWESDATRLRLLWAYLKTKVTGEADNGTAGDFGKLSV